MSAAHQPRAYQAWRRADGAVLALVAGEPVVLRASGALWLERERALVAADLHLEKGSAYAARGQLLPPYDTRDTLLRLGAEIARLEPRLVVMLGDAFHDCEAQDRLCRDDALAIEAMVAGRELVWLAGNHDPYPPAWLPGARAASLGLAGLRLRHEPGGAEAEVCGHLHPCARVVASGRSVRRRCFVTDGERLLLPAFGAYAGGLSVRNPAIASLFSRAPMVVALGGARAHPIGYDSVVPD